MFKIIKKNQKGIISKNGEITNIVGEGIYVFKNIEIFDIYRNFGYINDEKLEILYKNNKEIILENFYVFELGDGEIGILYREGKVIDFLTGGKTYFYFKSKFEIKLLKIDINSSHQIPSENINDFLNLKEKYGKINYLEEYTIDNNEKGIVLKNGKINGVLESGRYLFFTKFDDIKVLIFETKKNKLEVLGQELLTKDKYNLRINLSVFFFIKDIIKYYENYGYGYDFIYSESQFALREIIGKYSLDEILEKKILISQELNELISQRISKDCILIESIGIKDIILPGEMREIMNQLIQAEKNSQVNAVKRRDEVANVRNLLNTAKLYEENPMLLRLKEIDTLEKVVEKVKNLNITNGASGLMDLISIKK